ncbi:hypothetical protein [Nonomuraea mesophila]|uniref:hypothetical protein n=1 Tax=Nonomuraea mesophila TaxID=2530382 RepID=UPI001FE920BC|nr:hypothetical protein [Nonomuraea mesophila]
MTAVVLVYMLSFVALALVGSIILPAVWSSKPSRRRVALTVLDRLLKFLVDVARIRAGRSEHGRTRERPSGRTRSVRPSAGLRGGAERRP